MMPVRAILFLRLGLALAVVGANDSASCVSDDGNAVAEAAQHLHSFDKFELTYFDGRGLAEVARTLFVTAGRAPGSGFADIRLSGDEFKEKKGSGDLATNLNRVPVLNHNGHVIGQSASINRYVAKVLGFFGKDDLEAAAIDSFCEHVVDIKAAYRKLIPYKAEMSDEEKAAALSLWFDTPAEPALEGRKERQLQWFLGQVEGLLPGDGYAVGGRPSLVDAYLFNMLAEQEPELGIKGEPFESLEATTRVLNLFPKLQIVLDTFGGSPGMLHYLATRGTMGF